MSRMLVDELLEHRARLLHRSAICRQSGRGTNLETLDLLVEFGKVLDRFPGKSSGSRNSSTKAFGNLLKRRP
jgi:hypothetical protein